MEQQINVRKVSERILKAVTLAACSAAIVITSV